MISIVSGDLFNADVQTIVNTINCVGIMGKGIALEYKKRYPQMFYRYKELCDYKLIKIGSLWLYKNEDKWVLNFPTKDHWRNTTKIEYLELGLEKFIKTYKEKNITSIAFPLLGASNGKLDSDVSLKIMCYYLQECDIPILIFDNRYIS